MYIVHMTSYMGQITSYMGHRTLCGVMRGMPADRSGGSLPGVFVCARGAGLGVLGGGGTGKTRHDTVGLMPTPCEVRFPKPWPEAWAKAWAEDLGHEPLVLPLGG